MYNALEPIVPAILDERIVSGVTTREIGDDKHALAQAIDRSVGEMVMMKQVHGKVVHVVDERWSAASPPYVGDGLVTRRNDVVLRVRIADCAGVLLWDPSTATIAAVHSGWRGTKDNIVGECFHIMRTVFSCNPTEVRAYISPCASGNRYIVREDVARHFPGHIVQSESNTDEWLFDNKSAIREQLVFAGVKQTNVCVDPVCTIADGRFHSYRRDASLAGRCAAYIGLRSFEALVPQ